jgi:hypothetical protein
MSVPKLTRAEEPGPGAGLLVTGPWCLLGGCGEVALEEVGEGLTGGHGVGDATAVPVWSR